jgi:hypothetical protein
MRCHEAQTVLGAEPQSTQAEMLEHVQSCASCSEYRQEMLRMDDLIRKALTIPVETPSRTTPIRAPRFVGWQIAASLLASIAIAGSLWIASTQDSLAEQLVAHAEHEAFAIVRTDDRVDSHEVSAVLSQAGITLRDQAEVSFAESCVFGRHRVPHLVVQTDEGPVTVLILAHEEQRQSVQEIHEDGYDGVIVPAPRGVIAVLGKNVPVKAAAQKVLSAVEYR